MQDSPSLSDFINNPTVRKQQKQRDRTASHWSPTCVFTTFENCTNNVTPPRLLMAHPTGNPSPKLSITSMDSRTGWCHVLHPLK